MIILVLFFFVAYVFTREYRRYWQGSIRAHTPPRRSLVHNIGKLLWVPYCVHMIAQRPGKPFDLTHSYELPTASFLVDNYLNVRCAASGISPALGEVAVAEVVERTDSFENGAVRHAHEPHGAKKTAVVDELLQSLLSRQVLHSAAHRMH